MHRLIFAAAVSIAPLLAQAGQAEAESALTRILFEENMENISYALRRDGFVDILFGVAVPEAETIRTVERLRQHPDIPGVLAGRGKGNYCALP
jgi:hypothetical protein